MTETEQSQLPVTFDELAEYEGVDGPLCFALQREMMDLEVFARFSVPGEPESKQRARSSSRTGRHYTPQATRTAEERVGWAFRQAVGPHVPEKGVGFGVFLGFFCEKGQRRDVDNMTKLVLDGLNRLAWDDDSQVTEISAKVQRWQSHPRTEVVIYRTNISTHPTTVCAQCGVTFLAYPSAPDRRFCSNDCFYESRGGFQTSACRWCGKVFQRKPYLLKLGVVNCSNECKRAEQQSRLVHLRCAYCDTAFTLRPSELKRRPDASCCSATCRNKTRSARPGDDTSTEND